MAGGTVAAETARSCAAGTRDIWALLEGIPDPEIPVLNIVDLGIVREVRQEAGGRFRVLITPTYSGCPATEVIRAQVRAALDARGYSHALLEEVLSPPWTSDSLTPAGREKLRRFGIAPPEGTVASLRELRGAPPVGCPRCRSRDTEQVSEFGSTPCKAHYRCRACAEPFDYFKCL